MSLIRGRYLKLYWGHAEREQLITQRTGSIIIEDYLFQNQHVANLRLSVRVRVIVSHELVMKDQI